MSKEAAKKLMLYMAANKDLRKKTNGLSGVEDMVIAAVDAGYDITEEYLKRCPPTAEK